MTEQELIHENQKNIDDLITILSNPKQLFLEAKKIGGKGIGRIIGLVALFSFVNFICLVIGSVKMVSLNDTSSNGYYVLGVFIIGIVVTIIAASRAYNYALTNAFSAIYIKFTPFFQRICSVIIEKSEKVLQNASEAKEGKIKEILDFGNLLQSTFKNLPMFAQKRIEKMLNKTPIPAFVIELKSDIVNGRKEEASLKLHTQLDTFLTDSFFANNSTKWVYWLLPLNILIQYLIISFGIN